MVHHTSRNRPTQPSLQLTPDELQRGIVRIKNCRDEVVSFEPSSITDQKSIPDVEALSAGIADALIQTFGADTREYKLYENATVFDNGPFNYAYHVPISEVHASLARSKASSIALLERAITSLEKRLAELPAASESQQISAPQVDERKVFIVHGHDNEAKVEIARFLERIDFVPIILHEQASKNQTVIEKIESNSDVGFAIVLLTPDDEGNKKAIFPSHVHGRTLCWSWGIS